MSNIQYVLHNLFMYLKGEKAWGSPVIYLKPCPLQIFEEAINKTKISIHVSMKATYFLPS